MNEDNLNNLNNLNNLDDLDLELDLTLDDLDLTNEPLITSSKIKVEDNTISVKQKIDLTDINKDEVLKIPTLDENKVNKVLKPVDKKPERINTSKEQDKINNIIGSIATSRLPNTLSFQSLNIGTSFQSQVYCKKVVYLYTTKNNPYLLLHLIDGDGFHFKAFLFDISIDEPTALTLVNKVLEIQGICKEFGGVKSVNLYSINDSPETTLTAKDFLTKVEDKSVYATNILQTLETIEDKLLKIILERVLIKEDYIVKMSKTPFTTEAGYSEGALLKGLDMMVGISEKSLEYTTLADRDTTLTAILLVGVALHKQNNKIRRNILSNLDAELLDHQVSALVEITKIIEEEVRQLNTEINPRKYKNLLHTVQYFDFRKGENAKTVESRIVLNAFKTVYEMMLYEDRLKVMGDEYILQEGRYKIVKV